MKNEHIGSPEIPMSGRVDSDVSGVGLVQYTPGPWRAVRNTMGHILWIEASDGTLVAEVSIRREPDARLIAAAPELYSAMQAALGVLQSAIVNAEKRNDHPSVIRGLERIELQAREALVKANRSGVIE